MTMTSMPGQVRPVMVQPAATKRTGLMRAAIGSDHLITIQPRDKDGKPTGAAREVYVRVRDRQYHPQAKGAFVCLSPQCAGKAWKNEQAMAADHPDLHTMQKRGEVHVYAFWSDDLVDPKDPGAGSLGLISSGEETAS